MSVSVSSSLLSSNSSPKFVGWSTTTEYADSLSETKMNSGSSKNSGAKKNMLVVNCRRNGSVSRFAAGSTPGWHQNLH
jgi:hypothetical protein